MKMWSRGLCSVWFCALVACSFFSYFLFHCMHKHIIYPFSYWWTFRFPVSSCYELWVDLLWTLLYKPLCVTIFISLGSVSRGGLEERPPFSGLSALEERAWHFQSRFEFIYFFFSVLSVLVSCSLKLCYLMYVLLRSFCLLIRWPPYHHKMFLFVSDYICCPEVYLVWH